MTKVGIARLRAQLNRYLDVVKHGEDVVITDRGKPVAKLVAVSTPKRQMARRERLAAEGVLIPGKGRIRGVLRRPPRGNPELGAGVLRALLEERASSR
jgi:prevent-host-death family protein